jgi:hypothetical protein
MPIKLEDEYGHPWTAAANLGWLTLIAVMTCGIAAPLLGIYLSLWIWSKGRSAWPLICFSLASFVCILTFTLGKLTHPGLVDDVDVLGGILWVIASFSLRHEIQRYYKEREGWKIEIGPFFTFCFSALYINYCLNPMAISERGTLTTLDLRK